MTVERKGRTDLPVADLPADLASRAPRARFEHLLRARDVLRYFPTAYAEALWTAVRTVRPARMIEFGVEFGSTAIIAALAMEELGHGHVHAYDNWEDFVPGGPDLRGLAQRHIDAYGVGHRVTLGTRDFTSWVSAPEPCDLFYFDIDNDGAKVELMYRSLKPQIDAGLTVYFEGGSAERDAHRVMVGRTPIRSLLALTGYEVVVQEFPSLSRIQRAPTERRP